MDPVEVANIVSQVPPDIATTMVRSAVVAGSIRGIVSVLRTPLFGSIWYKGPWWLRPGILMGLTCAAFLFDALALGQAWFLALGSALTGLGAASVSHDWQSIWRKAQVAKKAKEAGQEAVPDELLAPDTPETPAEPPQGP
jgi:hypothetical protein